MLFSTEVPMLFYFVQVFGYLGTLEKSQKIYRKLPMVQRGARGQPGGRQEGAWRGPAPGRATCPPGWVPRPLVPYLGPYLFSRRGNPRTEVAFPIYVAGPPPRSVLLRQS